MRKTTRVGLFCAGIALLAPRVFADAIMLEGKNFSSPSEIFLIEVEQSNDADASGSFTLELCSHCKVKGEGVFLFNPNLSRAAFSRDFFAPFAGVSSLNNTTTAAVTPPTALLSSSINAIATQSTAAPTVSVSSNSSTSGSTVQLTASGGSNTNVSTSTRSTSLPPTAKGADPTFASNPEPATVFLLGTALAAGAVGRRALRGRRT